MNQFRTTMRIPTDLPPCTPEELAEFEVFAYQGELSPRLAALGQENRAELSQHVLRCHMNTMMRLYEEGKPFVDIMPGKQGYWRVLHRDAEGYLVVLSDNYDNMTAAYQQAAQHHQASAPKAPTHTVH